MTYIEMNISAIDGQVTLLKNNNIYWPITVTTLKTTATKVILSVHKQKILLDKKNQLTIIDNYYCKLEILLT
jgi:hypothetical protein